MKNQTTTLPITEEKILKTPKTIGFSHPPPKHGGPGSFQTRFSSYIKSQGWKVVYPEDGLTPDVILLVGGTKKYGWLWKNKRKGVPIVVRLAGLNWFHRVKNVGWKKYFINITRNNSLQFIRQVFADAVIYQSQFASDWWRREGFGKKKRETIIYNSIDLDEFKPDRVGLEEGPLHLLCVEGTLDYSPYAVDLINFLHERLKSVPRFAGTILYGRFQDENLIQSLHPDIDFRGHVRRADLPSVYRRGVYLSLDVNATCPNTVIEALASGIPVIGFDSGALGELVTPEAGSIVPFGADPWKLETPDFEGLGSAAEQVFLNWATYSHGARQLAEERYGIDQMASRYLEMLTAVSR